MSRNDRKMTGRDWVILVAFFLAVLGSVIFNAMLP